MPTERSLPSRRASPVARPRRSMPRSRISRPIRGRFGRVMRSSGSCAGWPASTSRLCSGLARTRSSCAPSIAAPSAPDASGASSHGGSQTTRRVGRCVPASTRATTLRRDARCACCCGYAIRVSPPGELERVRVLLDSTTPQGPSPTLALEVERFWPDGVLREQLASADRAVARRARRASNVIERLRVQREGRRQRRARKRAGP
jgi:hypothetical protein